MQHIIIEIIKIENSTKRISKEEFKKNLDLQDATIRRIEIIGEAVKNLPPEFIKRHPKIEWAKIAGTRDKLIHHYFGVDLDLTWEIIKKDIHPLKDKIEEILEEAPHNQ